MRPHWFYTTREQETLGLDRADVVLAIQPEEARDFASRTSARVELIEYAIPPRPARPRANARPVVGYFGSGNPWNVASLTAFDRVLVSRRDVPDAEFLVLGGITRAIGPLAVFQPAGRVARVADAYERLDLIVNPMRQGTGLKIKTVEALAYGRAVLSTRDGGIGLESCGADLLLADLDALADRLVRVLSTPGELAAVARDQHARYVAFHADVAARLDALVAGWAPRP
jgi:glycosyltransferase involved in cell wall biosynthesis